MFIDALLLGLSSGSYCVMFCAPVLVPWFLSKKIDSAGQNGLQLAGFLAGRLGGYMLLGIIAGSLGAYAAGYLPLGVERTLSGISLGMSGLVLIVSGLLAIRKNCPRTTALTQSTFAAALLGFFSGMRFCPPLFAAASRVFSGNGGALGGALYFLIFFAASSLYFTPFLLTFRLKKAPDYFRYGARVLSVMIGVYFCIFLALPALLQGIQTIGR